jgi:pseudaminic acid synthase
MSDNGCRATIQIGRHQVGRSQKPFICAEMSGNHNGSLSRALELVEAAARAGVHGLKLQTYTPETMTLDSRLPHFTVRDPKSPWAGRTLFDLYAEAATPYDWHAPIMAKCRELGLECFSTPFDETAVDFLEELKVPAYKVASFELTDIPLIRRISATNKPVIMSTGMASLGEISDAVNAARGSGAKDIILLKCTSSYPASPSDSNIATVPHLAETFDVQVGLSDHTLTLGAPLAAVALGATVIEKHFTLRRSDGGVDSAFSLEPKELESLVKESEAAWIAMGRIRYGTVAAEDGSRIFRRSLIVSADIAPGEAFTAANLRRIRPGFGLPCRFYDDVLGKKAAKAIAKGTPLEFGMWRD